MSEKPVTTESDLVEELLKDPRIQELLNDPDSPLSHPRFAEWLHESELVWKAGVRHTNTPSFHTWLADKERPVPDADLAVFTSVTSSTPTKSSAYEKLRRERFPYLSAYNTENPPPERLRRADEMQSKRGSLSSNRTASIVVAAACFIMPTLAWALGRDPFDAMDFFLFLLVGLAALLAAKWFHKEMQRYSLDDINRLRSPINLFTNTHTYPFTCSGKALTVTLWYQSSDSIREQHSSTVRYNDGLDAALYHMTKLNLHNYFVMWEQKFPTQPPSQTLMLQDALEAYWTCPLK